MIIALPPSLIAFLRRCVPTLQAAEVLLFFAAHPEETFTAEETVVAIRPKVVTVPAVKEYAAVFVASGLIIEADGRFQYGPTATELERAIGELAHVYNERPVTLITAITRSRISEAAGPAVDVERHLCWVRRLRGGPSLSPLLTAHGDPLFGVFAVGFWLFSLNQLTSSLPVVSNETNGYEYVLRAAGFILILVAIILRTVRKASR